MVSLAKGSRGEMLYLCRDRPVAQRAKAYTRISLSKDLLKSLYRKYGHPGFGASRLRGSASPRLCCKSPLQRFTRKSPESSPEPNRQLYSTVPQILVYCSISQTERLVVDPEGKGHIGLPPTNVSDSVLPVGGVTYLALRSTGRNSTSARELKSVI